VSSAGGESSSSRVIRDRWPRRHSHVALYSKLTGRKSMSQTMLRMFVNPVGIFATALLLLAVTGCGQRARALSASSQIDRQPVGLQARPGGTCGMQATANPLRTLALLPRCKITPGDPRRLPQWRARTSPTAKCGIASSGSVSRLNRTHRHRERLPLGDTYEHWRRQRRCRSWPPSRVPSLRYRSR
jgi:hypothetical protein